MASDKDYLRYVLGQMADLDGVTYRPMMGEYILYYHGKVIGGIYDNRLLLKPTGSLTARFGEPQEIPYTGAKPMLMIDVDDSELLTELIPQMALELPTTKRRN